MTNSELPLNLQRPHWQAEKRLKSGDCVWILTDVETYDSRYMAHSEPQTLFKAGIYDLETEHVGWGIFGKDIAFAIVEAGFQPPPWGAPLPSAIKVVRPPHDSGEERGRYLVKVELVAIDPGLLAIVPVAEKKFDSAGHHPNAKPGMWDALVTRAARENAIEVAALSMVGAFSAGDVRAAIGNPDADVTDVLQRLVREGKLLPPTGKKRGTRYQVAPPSPLIERADWTD